MASSTTSAAVSSGINVPEIVSGLMDVERVPITKLQTKVDQKTLEISTLGVFKSKVSALETAARAMSSPGIFSLRDTSSSNSAVATASATSAASAGSYSVKVAQTAQAAVWSVDGFSGSNQVVDLTDFQFTYASKTYRPQYSELAATTFSAGDRIQMTLSGGQAQSFSVTSSATTPTAVAAAINAKVESGDLEGVEASVVGGKLVIASINPIQGVTAIHQVPGRATLTGLSSFVTTETLSITVTGGSAQTYTLASDATPSQLVTRINDAVTAGNLTGVTAYLDDSGEVVVRANDPTKGVSVTYTQTDTTEVTNAGSAALGTVDPSTAGLPTNATLSDLTGWINSLDIGLNASVIQVTSSRYALNIQGQDSGADNSLTVSDVVAAAAITDADVTVSGPADPAVLTDADDGVYTLEFNGTAWSLSVDSDGTFDADTMALTTEDGQDLTIALADTPRAGDRISFSIASGVLGAVTTDAFYGSDELQQARDAYLSVNGLTLKRSTNSIDDVVTGLTIDLTGDVVPTGGAITDLSAVDLSLAHVQSANLRVTAGAQDLSAQAVKDFANAYNEVISFYKSESISSTDAAARGVLNGDSSLRSYMERLRSLYTRGLQLADGSTLSFTSIGVEFQRDGTLFVDESKLDAAVTNGLQEKFAAGIKIGVESDTMNFTSFVTQSLQVGGLLVQHVLDVEKEQKSFQDRIDTLETKMTRTEERLYKQYAALDALLFRLQTTSNALASAIDSLTASQGN